MVSTIPGVSGSSCEDRIIGEEIVRGTLVGELTLGPLGDAAGDLSSGERFRIELSFEVSGGLCFIRFLRLSFSRRRDR